MKSKMFTTLIRKKELAEILDQPSLRILDCRFSLKDTEQGRSDYARSHIVHAQYAHLDEDLSAQIVEGETGRHPWPNPHVFSKKLSDWGIDKNSQVVAYDYGNGAIASRLWCMLRLLGHESVAVLDGGWFAWQAADLPVSNEVSRFDPAEFTPKLQQEQIYSASDILDAEKPMALVDSRAEERFLGINEPIDPVAGHIPGAINLPFQHNVTGEGFWKSREELRSRFAPVMQSGKPVVFYCGSGVTACHNILSVTYAGFLMPGLYPGSWSEWITDPERVVATGRKD